MQQTVCTEHKKLLYVEIGTIGFISRGQICPKSIPQKAISDLPAHCHKTELNRKRRLKPSTTKEQTTKFSTANFRKMLNSSSITLIIQRPEANNVDLDEAARYEPPHQDLSCLKIQLVFRLWYLKVNITLPAVTNIKYHLFASACHRRDVFEKVPPNLFD